MSLDPFRRAYCPAAWGAEGFLLPVAGFCLSSGLLDSASVRALLERTQLPRAELRYMGVPDWLLTPADPLRWVPLELAVQVLGRIAWDALHGDAGDTWCGPDRTPGSFPAAFVRDQRECLRLGEAVIREYFTP